jgi:hypothetical protein
MWTEARTVVRVDVSDDALLAFEPSPPCVNRIPQIEGECRSRVEKIASTKYDGGGIEQDGSVHVTLVDVDG